MSNLLVQAHTASGRRGMGSKTVASPQAKADKSPSNLASGQTFRKTITRTLRDVNNAFLSWKDGLSPSEREALRLRQQKRDETVDEMKSVSSKFEFDSSCRKHDKGERRKEKKNMTLNANLYMYHSRPKPTNNGLLLRQNSISSMATRDGSMTRRMASMTFCSFKSACVRSTKHEPEGMFALRCI